MDERTKTFIKSVFPASVPIYRRIRKVRYALNILTPGMEEIFTEIYLNNSWADTESVSGSGSTFARTVAIRRELSALLVSVGAKSLLDAPCGDFNWMQHVDLGEVEYLGADVVRELIARNRSMYGGKGRDFSLLDITSDELPRADLILCRDCFIHLSFKHIHAAISNFKKSDSTFLLATTHTTVRENTDIASGEGRYVNLQLPPCNFPEPLRLITENHELGKNLGLWRLEDL
ncbi:MAG: hypothetical protein AUG51_08330 [Acidobacteria bacterium 13_1_20CM_3_53_8]|nr:MAG: hypothetical protein AUG51_08330 [Acidobacteria bacterium 13_1_20CM_3_53_8]